MRSVLVILCLLLSSMAMQPAASAGIPISKPGKLAPVSGRPPTQDPRPPGRCCGERCCGHCC